MKSLAIPEQNDIDLGEGYSPACEGFIESIKDFFVRNFSKDVVARMKAGKNYKALINRLEEDLRKTYDNPKWVEDNLAGTASMVKTKSLQLANVNGRQITTLQELLMVAKNQFQIIQEISEKERPFNELRNRLARLIVGSEDPHMADGIWLGAEKQLHKTSAQRYYDANRNASMNHPIVPALAQDARFGLEWPVSHRTKGEYGYNWQYTVRTNGEFAGPAVNTASLFASTIREMLAVAVGLNQLCYDNFLIGSHAFYEAMGGEEGIKDMWYADQIATHIFTSNRIREVADLAWALSELIGKITVGLYVVMFDKPDVEIETKNQKEKE